MKRTLKSRKWKAAPPIPQTALKSAAKPYFYGSRAGLRAGGFLRSPESEIKPQRAA